MDPVKRIEIVIDSPHLSRLLDALNRAGTPGYTILQPAHGRGDRGSRLGDDVSAALDNAYVLVACNAAQAEKLVDAVRPLLHEAGGLCLVSDS